MTLRDLQNQGRLRPHRTNREEVDELFQLAERGLADAQVPGVSADGRFMMAYDAAMALATIPLHCGGFRTDGTRHHQTTFAALPLMMGAEISEVASYFDACRAKRNASAYDRGGQTSDSEVEELIDEVVGFRETTIVWLRANYPALSG